MVVDALVRIEARWQQDRDVVLAGRRANRREEPILEVGGNPAHHPDQENVLAGVEVNALDGLEVGCVHLGKIGVGEDRHFDLGTLLYIA